MGKIIKSAYLAVDGPIATIVFSNGNKTQVLVTKRQALEIGEALVEVALSKEEWCIIREQIHSSPLLDRHKYLEEISSHMQGQISKLTRTVEKIVEQMRRDDDEGEEWKLIK